MTSDFFEVVLSQRACRDFAPDPVPDDDLERILEAATHAPSAQNTQPWVFVVVRDDEARRALGDLTKRIWDDGARDFAREHNEAHVFADVDTAIERGFGAAPVVVVVCGDTDAAGSARVLGSSVFPAVQNLLLAANALGYGSALTTLTTFGGDELRALLDLPERVTPMAIVPLGRPARPLGPPRRQPVATTAPRERYGQPW